MDQGVQGYICPRPPHTNRNTMNETESITNERYDYGRLWPDGTFNKIGSHYSESMARKEFDQKAYELKEVPESLRPVFARQRVITTTEIHPAEPHPEAAK
jgi:hypothetical protein